MSALKPSLLSTKPRKWIVARRSQCVGTSAEEVLPCICSNRRYDAGGLTDSTFDRRESSVSLAFRHGTLKCLQAIKGRDDVPAKGLLPSPSSLTAIDHSPFFLAIDCWPEDLGSTNLGDIVDQQRSSRLCKIPKALQMSYSDVMNAGVVDDILSILQPLAGRVHIVLIGKGDELIRCSHGSDRASTVDAIQRSVHEQSAQLAALALTLAKQGIPHISILDGGFGSVLRCFWNSENKSNSDGAGGGDVKSVVDPCELSFDLLFDVDHDAIKTLFLGDATSKSFEDRISSLDVPACKASRNSSETSSLLGSVTVDKYDDENIAGDSFRAHSSVTNISDIFTSTSSSVTDMAGNLSKKMFSYYK